MHNVALYDDHSPICLWSTDDARKSYADIILYALSFTLNSRHHHNHAIKG